MRMRLEAELGLGAHTLNHPGEASGGGWRAPHQEFGFRIGSPNQSQKSLNAPKREEEIKRFGLW